MRLTVTTFLSIDGVMQAPGGPTEDPSNGFTLGGWLVPFADADMGAYVNEWFSQADAFLLGRRTFDIFAGFWPKVTDPDDVVASRLNGLPKYVVTSSDDHADWAHTVRLTGDLGESVRQLKAQPGGEIQVHGSGQLVRGLHDLGLVDEFRLWTYPVVLGRGRRLFSDTSVPTSFELVDHKETSTGVSIRSFRPTGPIAQGAFDVESRRDLTQPV